MSDLLELPLAVLFHPAQTFRVITSYRKEFTYLPVVLLLLLAVAGRVASIFIVHFPLAELEPKDANVLLETAKLLVPVLTWVVASYAVTSILGGEALIGEILMAAAYSMVPFIVLSLPVAALSRVLGRTELGLYTFLNRAMWAWVLVLYLVSVRSLHDYGVGKTLLVSLLTLFAMGLIWALAILMYALVGNLKAFVQGLAMEIWMTITFR
jgi:hypothetical protein